MFVVLQPTSFERQHLQSRSIVYSTALRTDSRASCIAHGIAQKDWWSVTLNAMFDAAYKDIQKQSKAFQRMYLLGDMAMLCCFIADRTRAMPPQALGDDMEVPFMSWRTCSVHWGTGAIAPPGADSTTPVAPSGVGPLLDHVYCCPCKRSIAMFSITYNTLLGSWLFPSEVIKCTLTD